MLDDKTALRAVATDIQTHHRQEESNDTMSTSYGDVETVGREAKSEPEPASSSYSTPDGPSDHDREEASRALQEVKEDITAPTGDLDADMEQLNVEVFICGQQPAP